MFNKNININGNLLRAEKNYGVYSCDVDKWTKILQLVVGTYAL